MRRGYRKRNQNIPVHHLLEEKEEPEISDGCPKNVSETLPKHPLHLGPDHRHEEDHVDDEEHGDDKKLLEVTCLLAEVCARSSPCRFDLRQGGP